MLDETSFVRGSLEDGDVSVDEEVDGAAARLGRLPVRSALGRVGCEGKTGC